MACFAAGSFFEQLSNIVAKGKCAPKARPKKRFLSLYKWISKGILGYKTKTRAEGASEKIEHFTTLRGSFLRY